MQKLQALIDHLTEAAAARPEQIRGVMESGSPQASFSAAGPDLLLFRHIYTARVVFQHAPDDVAHYLALVYAWLEENGDPDTDAVEGWSGETVDDSLGDLDIIVTFEEEARYVPKPGDWNAGGVVTWRGQDYVPGSAVPGTAATATLSGEVDA